MMVLDYNRCLYDLVNLSIRRVGGMSCAFNFTVEKAHILSMATHADRPL